MKNQEFKYWGRDRKLKKEPNKLIRGNEKRLCKQESRDIEGERDWLTLRELNKESKYLQTKGTRHENNLSKTKSEHKNKLRN